MQSLYISELVMFDSQTPTVFGTPFSYPPHCRRKKKIAKTYRQNFRFRVQFHMTPLHVIATGDAPPCTKMSSNDLKPPLAFSPYLHTLTHLLGVTQLHLYFFSNWQEETRQPWTETPRQHWSHCHACDQTFTPCSPFELRVQEHPNPCRNPTSMRGMCHKRRPPKWHLHLHPQGRARKGHWSKGQRRVSPPPSLTMGLKTSLALIEANRVSRIII